MGSFDLNSLNHYTFILKLKILKIVSLIENLYHGSLNGIK